MSKKYEYESEAVRRAKAILARAATSSDTPYYPDAEKPTGIVTIADLIDAERALAAEQKSLKDFLASDDGMRESISPQGVTSVIVERQRSDRLEYHQNKVNRARLHLQRVKRDFLSDLED